MNHPYRHNAHGMAMESFARSMAACQLAIGEQLVPAMQRFAKVMQEIAADPEMIEALLAAAEPDPPPWYVRAATGLYRWADRLTSRLAWGGA